ncbi:MAG: hypothetical protein ACUVR4_03465 [Anaerolineae bacterium]
MNPRKLYEHKLISIPEAVSLVQSHQTIATAMAAAEPVGLLTELGRHRDRLEDVTVWVCLPLRLYDFILKPEMAGHFFVENWFTARLTGKCTPKAARPTSPTTCTARPTTSCMPPKGTSTSSGAQPPHRIATVTCPSRYRW